MRKSHIFLMIVAWFGLATYIVLNGGSEETEEDQAIGLNQKIQAVDQELQAQDERIEKIEAKMVKIDKLFAAKQQEPMPKSRNKANTERIQDERIEKLQAKMVEMEKLLAAKQQEPPPELRNKERIEKLQAQLMVEMERLLAAPPPELRNKTNTTLQEHLNATQELHVAEDAALPHVPHPTQEHLQTIRRLHEVKHKTDEYHSHPPVHIH